MNVLFTGRGTSGSWAIRGEQLGRAVGGTVLANALDVAAFDAVVVVKRTPTDLVQRIHRAGVKLVWDVVDAWTQPAGNSWGEADCKAWMRRQVDLIRPAAIVAATQAMAADCAAFGVPVLALPHHAWEGQGLCTIAPKVRTVGYQGGEKYLGRWKAFMEAECARRGWRFVVNPPSVAAVDIVVALRESEGYAARRWKSNVKMANAQGCGTPFIGNREAGYSETACGAELWADTETEMALALDALTPMQARVEASARMLAAAPRLAQVAATYRSWLGAL